MWALLNIENPLGVKYVRVCYDFLKNQYFGTKECLFRVLLGFPYGVANGAGHCSPTPREFSEEKPFDNVESLGRLIQMRSDSKPQLWMMFPKRPSMDWLFRHAQTIGADARVGIGIGWGGGIPLIVHRK